MKNVLPTAQVRVRHTLGAVALILGANWSLLAKDEIKDYVRVSHTQHLELSPGATVSVRNASGELSIEGWDQSGVEITSIKSTKHEYGATDREKATRELESIKISADNKGDQLVIVTELPKHRRLLLLCPAALTSDVALEYRIRVPRNARLIVDGYGDTHFDGVTGDIRANLRQGQITLRLPSEGQYAIDARTKLGNVISDFPGDTKRHWLVGHNFTEGAQAPHKLVLKNGYGDILILKTAQISGRNN